MMQRNLFAYDDALWNIYQIHSSKEFKQGTAVELFKITMNAPPGNDTPSYVGSSEAIQVELRQPSELKDPETG